MATNQHLADEHEKLQDKVQVLLHHQLRCDLLVHHPLCWGDPMQMAPFDFLPRPGSVAPHHCWRQQYYSCSPGPLGPLYKTIFFGRDSYRCRQICREHSPPQQQSFLCLVICRG